MQTACQLVVNADRLSVGGECRPPVSCSWNAARLRYRNISTYTDLLFLPVTAEVESMVLSDKKTGSSRVEEDV